MIKVRHHYPLHILITSTLILNVPAGTIFNLLAERQLLEKIVALQYVLPLVSVSNLGNVIFILGM